MRLWTVVSAASVAAGCGFGLGSEESSCTVDSDVIAISLADPAINNGSGRVTMRVGQTLDVCMFGSASCTRVDQRFEFRSDAVGVVSTTTDATAAPPACNQLASTHTYPCCPIRSGTVRAVGPGTALVQGVLSSGGAVQKAAGLIWCPPFGPDTGGCRPVAGIDVTP